MAAKRNEGAPEKKMARRAGESVATEAESRLVNLDEAIALLQTTRSTFYRWIAQGRIRGSKAGRQWRFERAEIERFLRGDTLEVAAEDSVRAAMQALQLLCPGVPEVAQGDSLTALVVRMIDVGVLLGASDIHLEPQADSCRLRYRVDGVLMDAPALAAGLAGPLADRWKAMFRGNVQEHQRPQDGRIRMERLGKEVDLRVCVVPALFGEALAARLLDSQAVGRGLTLEVCAPRQRQTLERALAAPYGLILFSGPAGSGKTTTAYASLQYRNSPQVKILTVEDPVEYAIAGAVQVPVQPAIGRTFAYVFRALMRQDPDLLYVSELRDAEIVPLCVQAALTGHLVLSTLHARSAAAALKRLTDMGAPAFAAADAARLIVGQRLVRRLCPECSRMRPVTPAEEGRLRRLLGEGAQIPASLPGAVGCAACKKLGYRGRVPVQEMLTVSPEIAGALIRGATVEEIERQAVAEGMATLAMEGFRLVGEGITTLDEVCGVLAQ